MTVLQWLTSVWGIVPIATLAVLLAKSHADDKRDARASHPTALPPEHDNDGWTYEYPEMYR